MPQRHVKGRAMKISSNTDFSKLSENDLSNLIASAQTALREKQESKRKEVVDRIKELAASIGTKVEIGGANRGSGLKGRKVPIKFQNPKDPSQKWSGRGLKPKWLQNMLDEGHDMKDFEV